MTKRSKDSLVLGLALFAMFFGAGNLIFPPALGLMSGEDWVLSGLGFFLTGIGMPLLGIIAVSRAGGTINDIGNKVGPVFSKIFATVIILAIGPLLAIPRTAATTFELSVKPLFPNISPVVASILFFVITLYFVITPSEVVDKVGKILTPLLLFIVVAIIIKGIISPIGIPYGKMNENPFARGFLEGYQTMDALASIVFGGIILDSIITKGYVNKREQRSLTLKAGMIAAIGLTIVYGGFIYLGASSKGIFPIDTPKTDLLIGITNLLFGDLAKVALGIGVSLACLTTAIGLTATVGNYFSGISNNRLSYKLVVVLTVIFSAIFATVGVERIVSIAVPLLITVYPVAIVLIIMNLFDGFFSRMAYLGAVIGALLISLNQGLAYINISSKMLLELINNIPLAQAGFAWLVPSLIGGVMGVIWSSLAAVKK